MKTLREIGEFGLIPQIREWMTAKDPSLIKAIGEDEAVIDMGREALLITTDILIEDIHFERSWTDSYRLGKKALSVNLSDIAAMGGTPTYFLISLGLPKQLSLSFVSSLYRFLFLLSLPSTAGSKKWPNSFVSISSEATPPFPRKSSLIYAFWDGVRKTVSFSEMEQTRGMTFSSPEH